MISKIFTGYLNAWYLLKLRRIEKMVPQILFPWVTPVNFEAVQKAFDIARYYYISS